VTGTVLRVSGPTEAVRSFLVSTHWKPCATYFQGEPRTRSSRSVHRVSGFNLAVSSASDLSLPDQVRDSVRFMDSEGKELDRVHLLGLHGVLDFGVASNPEAVFSNYRFPAELLACLSAYSVDLEVSHHGVAER